MNQGALGSLPLQKLFCIWRFPIVLIFCEETLRPVIIITIFVCSALCGQITLLFEHVFELVGLAEFGLLCNRLFLPKGLLELL